MDARWEPFVSEPENRRAASNLRKITIIRIGGIWRFHILPGFRSNEAGI